ncbi:MAG: NfeD family protein [Cyanobacteria bacterium P01_E01_bin.42]
MLLPIFQFFGLSGARNPLGNDRVFPKVKLTQRLDDEAIVTSEISPYRIGQVRYRASWWRARCDLNVTLSEGEIVRVVGYSDSIVLLVEPLTRVDPS